MYRIVILKNKTKRKKILFECQKGITAINKFNEIKSKNKVVIPIKFLSDARKMYSVEYDLAIIEKTDDNVINEHEIKDNIGRRATIRTKGWKILRLIPWRIEEKFLNYENNLKLSFRQIFALYILKPPTKQNPTRVVTFSGNKVFIYDDYNHTLLICKNRMDTIRLYNKIREASAKNINYLIFFGELDGPEKTRIYNIFCEKVGIDRRRLFVNSTQC